jgi:hypothetical protein
MAAEAWLEMLHMHFAMILFDSLSSIASAESELRAAERAEEELRRQYAPVLCSSVSCLLMSWMIFCLGQCLLMYTRKRV